MIKRTQNIVAESRYALPVMLVYAIAVWMVSGLLLPAVPFTAGSLSAGAWVQFACFMISAYLMVELNNGNALIRIYSRMVSCSFIALACAGGFLFGSMSGAILQLCVIAAYICLFRTYQDKMAAGWTYYAFLCIGLASVATVHVLFYVPLLWIMMFYQLTALSWRTFAASLLGLLTPYWFLMPFAIYQDRLPALGLHFVQLAQFSMPADFRVLTASQVLLFVFVGALSVTGIVHYWRNSYSDNIRIRQFFGCFIGISIFTVVFLVLQPQHYDMLIRILIVSTSPLIAHFLSLTYTRVTNVAFYVIAATAAILTIVNLWMPSLTF